MAGINSLSDLQPGDIMIAGQSEAPAKLLVYGGQLLMGEQFRIGKFVAGHAGVIVPGNKLVEAMPGGARIRDLRSTDWSPGQMYFRMPEDYVGQAYDAAAYAMAMVGTPYSIASYAYLAAWRFHFRTEWLANRINRRHQVRVFGLTKDLAVGQAWSLHDIPLEAICSVLAEQAWTLAGKKVIRGTAPQVVTPGMLTERLWLSPLVLRGGAGIL